VHNVTIEAVARVLIPFIQLFGLYVIVHGDSGPGGGFQGGVILGASFILHAIVFGAKAGRKRVSQKVSDILSSTGVLIYGGVGVAAMIAGGMYLEYAALSPGHAHAASHYGIFAIEVGVGITVAAVMATLFFLFAARGRSDV